MQQCLLKKQTFISLDVIEWPPLVPWAGYTIIRDFDSAGLEEFRVSNEQSADNTQTEAQADTAADLKAVVIVFCTAVVMALHFVSGFTFDF